MSTLYATGSHQQRVDEIQSQARRDAVREKLFKPRPESSLPLAQTDDLLSKRIADEIGYVQRLLEGVSDKLVCDPIVIQRHTDTLQAFDVIGQILGHLADVTMAANRDSAVDRIGMHELQSRLRRRPLS